MGPTPRHKRHSQHHPDTPPDSDLSRSPSASDEVSSDKSIDRPPATYHPPNHRPERVRDRHSHSQEHGSRSSRTKPRVDNQNSHQSERTLWDESIGPSIFSKHREPQSARLPGNGDRIFFQVGIDTEGHSTRAKLTLPKGPGKGCFTSSRKPRISQDPSKRESSGRHSRPRVSRTEEYDRDARTKDLNDARRDARERMRERARRSSNRGQDDRTPPRLTRSNVASNARSASLSYLPNTRDTPPFTPRATVRRDRTSESRRKPQDHPSSRVPIHKVHGTHGETNRSAKRGDTYPSRNRRDTVSRGRRSKRDSSRMTPNTAGDDQVDTATYRARSPMPDPHSVHRQSRPTRTSRRSSNGHPSTPKDLGLESSPTASDISPDSECSVRETRRTVKTTQQTSYGCSGCTVL